MGGDVTLFGHVVVVADLARGVTRRAPRPGAGVHQRVYVSEYTIPPGEGLVNESNGGNRFGQVFSHRGRYQPYGVYVPEAPAPHGVLLMLHGLEENHSGRIWFPAHGYETAHRQLADEPNRIIAAPLARGWAGWYSGYSERDVLDVLDDVLAHYPVDRTNVVVGGVSMGGYGTFRLAALHPDRFAGALTFVGYTGDCLNGTPLAGECTGIGARDNAIELARNLRWVPIGMSYAGADQLVWVNNAVAARERFQALGYAHQWWLHPTAEHITQVLVDEWGKEAEFAKDLRLVTDPHRVTYRTATALDDPALGLVHDHAYWVSAIRPRGEGWADVDVSSFGCGAREPVTDRTTDAGTRYVPWVGEGIEVKAWRHVPAADRLEATLGNVSSFSVDSRRACVQPGPLDYEVTTDGPVTISLSDGRALRLASAGTHTGTLPAATVVDASGGAGPAVLGRELAKTGGSVPGAAAAGLAALAAAAAIRWPGGRRPACGRPGSRT
jgi:pimeloyl-ACP methyl ester carboxylesterase